MAPKLIGISLARDADYKPELPVAPGLHSRKGVLNDNRSCGLNAEQFCRHQITVRGRFPSQVLGMDHVAIDLHVEEMIHLGCLQDSRAILARSDNGDSEFSMPELTDEFHAPLVRLNSLLFDNFVDQLIF